MKYYYNDGYHSHGPFTLEEIKDKVICSRTLINVVGTRHWVLANELEEFKEIIRSPEQPPRLKRKRKVCEHNT